MKAGSVGTNGAPAVVLDQSLMAMRNLIDPSLAQGTSGGFDLLPYYLIRQPEPRPRIEALRSGTHAVVQCPIMPVRSDSCVTSRTRWCRIRQQHKERV